MNIETGGNVMLHRRKSATAVFFIVATAGLVVGCSSGNVIGPNNQPEVTNLTDSFQFQATGLDNITQTLSYTWQNTGTVANVDQSGTLTGGSATLVIRDAAATQVYSRNLGETGTFATTTGTQGAWSVQVVLTNASGTVNFRAQKP